MNKKNLSVVMAGAMLATSVAPVLADTTNDNQAPQTEFEVNNSEKGLLIKELRNLLESKTFASITENGNLAGKSVYYATLVGTDSSSIDLNIAEESTTFVSSGSINANQDPTSTVDGLNAKAGAAQLRTLKQKYNIPATSDRNLNYQIVKTNVPSTSNAKFVVKRIAYDSSNIDELVTAIQKANKGTKVYVNDRGFVEYNGAYYHNYKEDSIVYDKQYSASDLKLLADKWKANSNVSIDNNGQIVTTGGTTTGNIKTLFPSVYDMSYYNGVLTVKTRRAEDQSNHKVLTYKAGDDKVNFTKPLNDKNEVVSENGYSTIVAYEKVGTKVNAGTPVAPNYNLYTVTITDVDYDYTTTLSTVYDGLFLTEDGQELLNTMKEYDSKGWNVIDVKTNKVTNSINKFTVDYDANGIYSLTIRFEKPIAGGKTEVKTVKITSDDKENMEMFASGMSVKLDRNGKEVRRFPVEKLAGSNRYETAVKVAKENADIKDVAVNGNIVLVNGNSLVDGLAAAPLAASAINLNHPNSSDTPDAGDKVAPILLTENNSIPKATKDYMKEVIAEQKVGQLDKVTVYLVGGEGVISKSIENELKEIGFRVVRAGGEDREATSLAVAELIEKDTDTNITDAFVVGANGEADAMSIAPVAAKKGMPIIVESVHGIKENTIDYLKGYKDKQNNTFEAKKVTIIGGNKTVSEATEEKLTDAKIEVDRLFGNNRQETNAKVINTYFTPGTVDRFVVSKDGIKVKGHLIDALTSTSLAVRDGAPLLLGTDKLSKEQISSIELAAKKTGVYVYQIGEGVLPDVVKTIAKTVGWAK